MCGRYAIFAAPHRLVDLFGLTRIPNFPARYNAAPLQDLPIIIRGHAGMARWGLLPPWATQDDKGLCAKTINARSETVSEKPAFQESWQKKRRCLVPVNGFYEWQGEGEEKQAYYLSHKTDDVFVFAGLWSKKDDLLTFTVLTKDADSAIAAIHHRMPVILRPAQAAEWFDADESQAQAMIEHATGAMMNYRPVSAAVGKVANDAPELMEEVPMIARQATLL